MTGPLRPALAVHGGAGTISRKIMTPRVEREVRRALAASARGGWAVLKAGGSSVDAVEAAVRVLEDCPHFNAGRGAVFTREGSNELDATIMDGATMQAGAVAAVRRVKNPISLARRIMERSPHVMLSGRGAESFARREGLDLEDPGYFRTERRWRELLAARARDRAAPSGHGTVGAVALDSHGHLAAATSTGGMTNKHGGRVGDSAVVGAGTFAADGVCAVSTTGHGELFLRGVGAHDLWARMAYAGRPLGRAADEVLAALERLGGGGGLVAVDARGNLAMPFTTEGMYRAWVDRRGRIRTAIWEK